MSWPIGYAKPTFRFHTTPEGTIHANGVPVTDSNGWIDVRVPASAMIRGAPDAVSVRIRVVPDADDHPFLYAEQIEVGGRRYGGLHALMVAEGVQWVGPLARAIHEEIARCVDAAARGRPAPSHSRAATRPLRPVRNATRSPDDTWDGDRPVRDERRSTGS